MSTILLTGAAGYIASHTWIALQEAGFKVIGIDNFSNSSPIVLSRLEEVGGRPIKFEQINVCDASAIDLVFSKNKIDAVVHFAAFKSVGESTERPLDYYANNVGGLVTVCKAMQAHSVNRIVFSSSATVYGQPEKLPICEDAPVGSATNPYGATKVMCEGILRDVEIANVNWQTACLRYFNPVGAHASGRIGEDPRGTPNNLMPYVAQVAIGKREKLQVFGRDYPTPDGTGVRDYIHVSDLAEAHVAAVRALFGSPGSFTVNVGTGRGYSVMEIIRAYEKACGRQIPYEIVERRTGDVAACYADPSLAQKRLGWRAIRGIDQMCIDSWRWQQQNPEGYLVG